MSNGDGPAVDLRILRLHLRPRRGRPRRRHPAGHRLRGHPDGLVLPGLRRPQGGLLALRGLGSACERRLGSRPASVRAGAALPLEALVFAVGIEHARGGDRRRAPAGAVLRRLDGRSGPTRSRSCCWRSRSATGSAGGWPTGGRDLRALCALVLVGGGAAGGRAVRRAPVPVAERRARSTTSRSARSPARCSGCSCWSRCRCCCSARSSPWAMRLKLRVGRGRRARSPGGCTRSRRSARWSACSSSRCGRSRSIGTQRTFLVFALALGARRGARPAARAALLVPRRASRRCSRSRPGRPRRPSDGRVLYETRDASTSTRGWSRRGRHAPARAQRGPGDPLALPARHRADRRLLGRLPVAAVRDRLGGRRARIAVLGTAAGTTARAYGALLPGHARSTPSRSTASCSSIGRRYFDLRGRPQLRDARRGRAAVPAPHRASATTRSSSTPTASPTSPST